MVVGGVRKVCLAPLTTRPPRVTTTVTALATDYAHPTASSCIGSLLEPMDPQLAHNDAAMRLHPFVSTAQRRGGDNSVDNTADSLYHGVSQDTHTERLFGERWKGVASPDTDQGNLVMEGHRVQSRAMMLSLRAQVGQSPATSFPLLAFTCLPTKCRLPWERHPGAIRQQGAREGDGA